MTTVRRSAGIGASTTSAAATFRRAVVWVTVISFSIAALLGIAVLLREDPLGSTESNVLASTMLIGVVSMAALSYLAPSGARGRLLGAAGGVVVLVPLVSGLMVIWGPPGTDLTLKLFATGALVAVPLAQGCLLLATAGESLRRHRSAHIVFVATLACATALSAMSLPWIWIEGFYPGEAYSRAQGVLAILDVLGTVVALALLMLPNLQRALNRDDGAAGGVPRSLPDDVWQQIGDLARSTGRPADEVVRHAVTEAARRHPPERDGDP